MPRLPQSTYRRLAKLCIRHNSGNYYEAADHLAQQLALDSTDKRRVKRVIAHYVKLQKEAT